MPSQEEHRHFPRSQPPRNVMLTLRQEAPTPVHNTVEDNEPLHLSCRDVSLTGLGVIFPYSIRPDTDVELWMRLPDDTVELHLFGTVAWCAAPGGEWQAGIALDLERSDGATWAAHFDGQGHLNT